MGDHVLHAPRRYVALLRAAGAAVDLWQTDLPPAAGRPRRRAGLGPRHDAPAGAGRTRRGRRRRPPLAFEQALGERLRAAYPADAAGTVAVPVPAAVLRREPRLSLSAAADLLVAGGNGQLPALPRLPMQPRRAPVGLRRAVTRPRAAAAAASPGRCTGHEDRHTQGAPRGRSGGRRRRRRRSSATRAWAWSRWSRPVPAPVPPWPTRRYQDAGADDRRRGGRSGPATSSSRSSARPTTEMGQLRQGQVLIGMLDPYNAKDQVEAYAKAGRQRLRHGAAAAHHPRPGHGRALQPGQPRRLQGAGRRHGRVQPRAADDDDRGRHGDARPRCSSSAPASPACRRSPPRGAWGRW